RDLREQAREREDLRERDEGHGDEYSEVERERGRGDLAREERSVGVERDRRQKEGERDHEDHGKEHERRRRLVLRQAGGEGERGDPQAAAQRHEREMSRRGLDAAVALDLEGERT